MAENNRIPQPQNRSTSGGRKKKQKKGIGLFGALIYFLFIVGISALLAAVIWKCADDVLALTKEDIAAVIEIGETDSVDDIADMLREEGIIEYPFLFKLYASFSNAEEKIDPGRYEVRAVMDYRALVKAMRASSSYRSTVSVTIPEGFTLEQTLERLAENEVNTLEELKKCCASYAFTYDFLAGQTKSAGWLEGYLFPDTYEFYINEAPETVIKKLLANFDRKWTDNYQARAEELGYTVGEIITVASLIEKEAASDAERGTIASVIYNRLNSDSLKKLQIDAALQYVLPERKEILTASDLEYDSPYNTYMYEGLPPGPIANPGLKSIKAALYPEDTGYYYYALTEEGGHQFSKTYDEHQAVIDANPGVYGQR